MLIQQQSLYDYFKDVQQTQMKLVLMDIPI